ncbi:hypothetical protein J4209_02235 [Candidatus Woesearchaeota archaeon]|nr:hypothetical protein [Candidatus Woesearchaeota archaeon]
MVEANLIVTYDPAHAGSAKEEVDRVLKEIKNEAKHLKSGIDGIFNTRVKDARKVVQSLVKLCKKKPDLFDKTFHWIPIDKWVKASIKDMQKELKKFDKAIKEKESWKMDLGKRKTDLHEKDLIIKLTEVINKPKVDLEKPDKIVKVEIIGNKAGIALLGKDELLNIPKLKGK